MKNAVPTLFASIQIHVSTWNMTGYRTSEVAVDHVKGAKVTADDILGAVTSDL